MQAAERAYGASGDTSNYEWGRLPEQDEGKESGWCDVVGDNPAPHIPRTENVVALGKTLSKFLRGTCSFLSCLLCLPRYMALEQGGTRRYGGGRDGGRTRFLYWEASGRGGAGSYTIYTTVVLVCEENQHGFPVF